MVSAFLIRQLDQAATLDAMFGRVKSLCPDLGYLRSTITDRGSAIDAARRSAWIQTVHLFCFRHARQNFMKSFGLSEHHAHIEADSIFGRRDNGLEGIISLCDLDYDHFGRGCKNFMQHWVAGYGENAVRMCAYFERELKDLERGMISSVRLSAGLPLTSKPTTNFSKSMNEKAQRRYLQEHLPDVAHVLVNTLSGLLEGQLTDMARARVGQGSGQYRLNPKHPDYK